MGNIGEMENLYGRRKRHSVAFACRAGWNKQNSRQRWYAARYKSAHWMRFTLSQWAWLSQLEFNDSPAPPWAKPVALVGLAFLIWLGYAAWRNKDDFRITVRRSRVSFHGRFPLGLRPDAEHFLLNDVAPAGTIRVIGNWRPGRVLRVAVQGNVSCGQVQQIRNFMKLVLKGN